MKLERAARAYFRSEGANLRPEGADLRPEKADLRPGRDDEWNIEQKSLCVLQDFVPFGAAAQ